MSARRRNRPAARPRFGWRHLACAVLVASLAPAAFAGGIVGFVRDAVTQAPLAGIDLDVFDALLGPTGLTAITAADGSYSITVPLAGAYAVRCDPTLAQGYVDQYYPGVFLKSSAGFVNVPALGSAVVSFNLQHGGTISGHVRAAITNAPLDAIDIDVYTDDPTLLTRVFLGSIDAASDPTGAYSIGQFPPGIYYLRANPLPLQYRQTRFYNNQIDLLLAAGVAVVGTANTPNVDFALPLAGAIQGSIVKGDAPGNPLQLIDLDVFDKFGTFLPHLDALTDNAGNYLLGGIPPGDYYLGADPLATDGYVDAFWPSAVKMTAATLIHVVSNATNTANFALSPGGTIAGRVTAQATGAVVAGARITIFDVSIDPLTTLPRFDIVIGAGATTDLAGNYEAGALLPGPYKVRVEPPAASGLAFKFYDNVVLGSQGTTVTAVAGQRVNNIRFALLPGGNISGVVRDANTLAPIPNADLDVFAINDEFIGALDAKTDLNGTYVIPWVPTGSYKVKVQTPLGPYPLQYWNHSFTKGGATLVSVAAPGTAGGVDFDLGRVSDTGGDPQSAAMTFGLPLPNPFIGGTHLQFSLARPAQVQAFVYDPAGRRVCTILARATLAAGAHEIAWDGRNAQAQPAAAGIYWLQVDVDHRTLTRKLVRLHR